MFCFLRSVFLICLLIPVAQNAYAGTIEPQTKRSYTPIPYPHEIVKTQPIKEKTNPKKFVTSANDVVSVELSGQVNRAITYADNGVKEGLIYVDNDNSPSRFRVHGLAEVNDRFSIGANIDVDIASNSSYTTDIATDTGAATLRQRKTEILFISKDIGTISAGQGYMVSFTSSESDLSKTDAATLGCTVEEITGGITFRQKHLKGAASKGPTVGAAFDSMDGFRTDRIRWDSPSIYGFTLAASHAIRHSYDMGLSYNGKIYDIEIEARSVHASNHKKYKQTSGSISVLFPSGFNIGGGLGVKKLHTPRLRHTPERRHPFFYVGKVGYITKPFSIGDTAFAIDYGSTRNGAANKDVVYLTGATLAQHIDKASTEIYIGARHHRLHRVNTKYHDIFAGFIGARIRF